MIRRALVALALALPTVVLPALPASAVEPPNAPTELVAWPTATGTRLRWTQPFSEVTTYNVLRRAPGAVDWTTVGTPAAPTSFFTDTTIAPGTTGEYAVTATGPGGTSGLSNVATAARAATDPTIGTQDVLVLDLADGRTIAYDSADGDVLRRMEGFASGGVGGPSDQPQAYAMLGFVPGPGTYTVGATPMSLIIPDDSCPAPASGTLTVTEVLYDDAGLLETLAASFAAPCDGMVHGVLRWNSTVPYAAATITTPATDGRVPAGTFQDRTATVTSLSGPVTFGAATITGTDPSYFSVLGNACDGATLANGQTCTVVVRVTSSGTATRTATLNVADNTARGSRTLPLTVVPTSLPAAPTNVVTGWQVGRVTVTWEPPPSASPPVTGYRIHKYEGTEPAPVVAETTGLTFTEENVPGSIQAYGIAAVNEIGEGPIAWGSFAVAPPNELVYEVPNGPEATALRSSVVGQRSFPVVSDSDVATPAVSPDGSRLAYARLTGAGYDIWVRNADGSGTPTNLTGSWMPGASDEGQPAFSNDGRYVAFTRATDTAIDVYAIPATGGAPVKRALNAADPTFLSDSRSLVVTDLTTDESPLVRVSPAGARTAIPGTAGAEEPAVSPDGRWIAFSAYDADLDVYGLGVVPVAGGFPEVLFDESGGTDLSEPAWRGDGQYLVATEYYHLDELQVLRLVRWTGSEIGLSGNAPTFGYQPSAPTWRSVGLALASPPYLTRTTATINFVRSAPYTATTCRLDNGPVTACASSWTGTGLAAGPHTLVITASAGVGQTARVLSHTFTVDASAPVLKVTSPAAPYTLSSTVAFRYTGSDASGIAAYDVRYRKAPLNGAFGAWTIPAGWGGTKATQVTLSVAPGWEYCFAVRARDGVGNFSGWTAERCIASPLDDRHLGASGGWTRPTGIGYYKGTYTSTTVRGATLSRTGVQAKRLVVVATRCATCGTVAVYMGSSLVATINLAYGTTQKAYQFVLPAFTSIRTGTVTLRVTSTGKTVQIDGLGSRRT